jgi:VanZ family protein
MQRFFQISAPACIVLLAVLSLLPGNMIIRTGLNTRLEHVIAYLGTTIVVFVAYRSRLGLGKLTTALIAYAGILEVAQNFSPGRHPSMLDFAASSLGVMAGTALFQLFSYQLSHRFGR